MSQLLKTLSEQRGAKHKEAQTIIEKVTAEKRGFTDEERSTVTGLQSEVDKLDGDIQIEVRNISQATKVGPTLSKQEERDMSKFQIGKVIRHLDAVYRGRPTNIDGIEAEMVQEGEKEARQSGLNANGLALPALLMRHREQRATLSVTGGTTDQYGGELVATEKRGILGDFYKSSALERAGALVLTGLVGNVDLPRYVQGSDPVKKTENEAAGDVAGTFTALSLTPRRLPGYAAISDQLLAQSNENIEAFIGNEIGRSMAAVKEVAFFHGAGTSEPTGIAATVGIGSVVGGTNGAAPDWADIVSLWKEVSTDNADIGALGYFTNTKVIAKLLQTAKVSSTDSQMIMNELNSLLLGFPVYGTNAVKSNLTKGGSGAVCSAIFFGNANDFVVGYWGGIMLEVVRDTTDAKAGQRTLVANTYYDAGVLRAQSFSAMLDALTA